MTNDSELLEEASNLCHREWMDWSKNLAQELDEAVKVLEKNIQYLNNGNVNDISREKLIKENKELSDKISERIERWQSLWIPYEDLSEEMKEYDRIYARKILDLKD